MCLLLVVHFYMILEFPSGLLKFRKEFLVGVVRSYDQLPLRQCRRAAYDVFWMAGNNVAASLA